MHQSIIDEKKRIIKAGGIVLKEENNQKYIALHYRNNYKDWGFPKGHLEEGETLEECALRELEEETGLKANAVEYIGTTEIIEPKDFFKTKHFVSFQYRVRVKGRPEIVPEEREIADIRWMTLEVAAKQDDLASITRKTLDQMLSGEDCPDCVDLKTKWLRAKADYQNLQNLHLQMQS